MVCGRKNGLDGAFENQKNGRKKTDQKKQKEDAKKTKKPRKKTRMAVESRCRNVRGVHPPVGRRIIRNKNMCANAIKTNLAENTTLRVGHSSDLSSSRCMYEFIEADLWLFQMYRLKDRRLVQISGTLVGLVKSVTSVSIGSKLIIEMDYQKGGGQFRC